MRLKEYGFPQRPSFICRALPFPFLHLGVKGLHPRYRFHGNVYKVCIGEGGFHLLCLFMGFLDHIDVFGDVFCVTVVGDHLRDAVNNIEHMETSATQLEIIHDCLGGDVGVDGIVIPELTDPCVLDGVNDEGAKVAFGGLMQLEIMQQIFVDSLGAGAENGSGVV